MTTRKLAVGTALAVALAGAPGAASKDFGPGDLRLCNASRCIPITSPEVLPVLGRFYYSGRPLRTTAQPPLGAATYELRFPNGYATGIVSSAKLDRFLSYGVHLERFRRGVWYRVPAPMASELRRLARGLQPMRLTRAAVAKSR